MQIHRARRGRSKKLAAKLHLNFFSALLLFAMPACSSANSGTESLYTSVKPGDCRKLSAETSAFYESRGLTAEECDAAKPWRLYAVSSDARSWVEVARGATLWSTEEQVVHRSEFGNFPNIGAEKVEWRITKTGAPIALIFRIAAQDPQRTEKNLTRLFVLGFRDNTPYFCGMVKSNEEARALAEREDLCAGVLKTSPIAQ